MRQVLLVAILGILSVPVFAQNSNSRLLGWDLSYASVLKINHIGSDEWIAKWLGQSQKTPVEELILKWKDEAIISSILIEHPAFHAGEHITLWFVRTRDR